MSLLPQYTHIVNPKLKNIYLTFDDEGNLIIKSPKVSQKKIEQLLLKKALWINKSREKIQQKKGKTLDFSKDKACYFLGETYPFTLIQHSKKKVKLEFDGKGFVLFYHEYDEALFQTHLDRFYKSEAQKHLPSHVAFWSDQMGLSPTEIRYLQALPLSMVKIDRSLIFEIYYNLDHQTAVKSMIALLHGLGFEVVAEGVETSKEASLLYNLGCNYAQGYLFSRPLPALEFQSLIK